MEVHLLLTFHAHRAGQLLGGVDGTLVVLRHRHDGVGPTIKRCPLRPTVQGILPTPAATDGAVISRPYYYNNSSTNPHPALMPSITACGRMAPAQVGQCRRNR